MPAMRPAPRLKVMKSRARAVAVAGGWIVVLAVLAVAVWTWRQRSRTEAEVPSFTTAVVERRDVEVVAEAAGLVEPVQVVEVKANASGELLDVYPETGDVVTKGSLLAEIDPRDVQSALDQAQADHESASVRLAIAEAELRRSERLLEEGVIAEQELDVDRDVAASARATLVRAETSLRLAREKRQDVTIRAPINGTVLERNVEPGQIVASATANVSGGTALFLMADLSTMQVRTKVDEVDIGDVHGGQQARVTVEAYPNRTFVGTVAKIEPQAVVEQNVTLFPVLVRLDNSEGLLRVGMNAEVSFEIASRPDAVAVPNSAVVTLRDARTAAAALGLDPASLQRRPQGPGAGPGNGYGPGREAPSEGAATDRNRPGFAFVQTDAQTGAGIEPRRVVLGLSDWEYTEVVEGLEPGERVVLISAVQLQRRQQELSERVRQRFGGPLGTGNGSRRN